MPHDVIMPALGMTQDTGLIVAWHKQPGDAVSVGDVLFEVETDKATMEVEAAHEGFIETLLAGEGEEAPVGQVIAVISQSKPDNPIQSRLSESDAPAEPVANVAQEPVTKQDTASEKTPPAAPPQAAADGRILASPKTRRLALEQGLNLLDLVADGVPQPFHVRDLETLKNRPVASERSRGDSLSQLTASVSNAGFAGFQNWLADKADVPTNAILAAFAAASLRAANHAEVINIRVDQPTLAATAAFANPDLNPLSQIDSGEAMPVSLILRDLTSSRITGSATGGAEAPVLTLCEDGDAFVLTLNYTHQQADDEIAIQLLDGFAARLDEPLRHLL